jgi:predicted AAA+ superfamily ATPase
MYTIFRTIYLIFVDPLAFNEHSDGFLRITAVIVGWLPHRNQNQFSYPLDLRIFS